MILIALKIRMLFYFGENMWAFGTNERHSLIYTKENLKITSIVYSFNFSTKKIVTIGIPFIFHLNTTTLTFLYIFSLKNKQVSYDINSLYRVFHKDHIVAPCYVKYLNSV